MGSFADRTQSRLGTLAISIYDGAYVGMSSIARAQNQFLRFAAARLGVAGQPFDAEDRKRLQAVLNNLDIAIDRAMSDKARALSQAARARVADVTAGTDPAALADIDAELAKTVPRYDMDALDARDSADVFVTEAKYALYRAILVVLGLAALIGLALDQAVITSLNRSISIARSIADGKLDNHIVAKGSSETAHLLRALAAMQAAIVRSFAETRALHAAEAHQHAAHQAELTGAMGRLRELSDSTFEGLMIHREGKVLDANAAFCSMVGLPLDAISGASVASFANVWAATLNDPPDPSVPEVREIVVTTGNGEPLPVEIRSRDISYAGGPARVTALRDIRERRAAESRIHFLAHHDVLTGLANRFLLHDIATRELALAQNLSRSSAVLCVDLDRFKTVNDTLGHQSGDLLLKQVADRIRENIRDTDIAARTGGDEFIVVQTRCPQPSDAAQLARRLVDRLSEPYDLEGQRVCIGASIGIALQPQDGTQVDVLLKYADLALYRAKSIGRGNYCFFEAEMDTLQRERREMEQDLAQAIAAGRMELFYQPLFGTEGEEVVAFEALVRWPHPMKGLIQPNFFIPLAEETGLIVPLGKWVLETACRAAVGWPKDCRVAVNVSARQFKDAELPEMVAQILARTGLPADRLELEVTESLLIDDTDQALHALTALKALGLRIALDDFGTGYSSLSYLQRFPFDKIKIDKTFVQHLTTDSGAQAIVKAILAMSHALNLEVTAEGVETRTQLALLRAAYCDEIQGFLLGRPMQSKRVDDYLSGRAEQEAAELVQTTAG